MADQEEDQGITAYHGSPHKFDQFNLNNSGMGFNAYGHGIYLTGDENAARNFSEEVALTTKKPLSQEAYKFLNDYVDSNTKPENWLHGAMNNAKQYSPHLLREYEGLDPKDLGMTTDHMYEVKIRAHPDHFLDYDEDVSQQSSHVKKSLRMLAKFDQTNGGELNNILSKANEHNGGSIVDYLEQKYGGREASKLLHQHGIKGTKYFDGGKEPWKDERHRNYVVFDDKLVNVKRRYAHGGEVEGYASGGAVEDRDHLGFGGVGEGPVSGSTGSAAGNSYGGGSSSSSGASSSSGYGNDSGMASARAADRASVAGYSADAQQAGKGFVGAGDGGNYADPRNRAYAEQMAKSARQSYLDANYPESPRLGDLAQPNPAAILKQPNRPSTPTPPNAYGQAAPQPSFPHTPTPFSGYPRDVQNALNPTRPDSSFGGTALDPTGAQTTDVLKNLGTATDAVTMLNAPGFWGGVTRFVAGTPSQPTPQQESQMAKIFSPDMPIARIGDPSLGARAGSVGSMPSGTTSYGSDLTPSGSSVSRPVTPTPSTAYGGMSSQDSSNGGLGSFAGSLGSQGPAQQNAAPRQDFNSAFAAARSGGNKTFNWTNPRTGKTGTYGTQLARKAGGRVPSMSEPDEWLVEKNEPENKPVKKANKRVSKPERNPIVSRALMISSKKS